MQLIIYCPLGNSQSLKSQSDLYSTIRNSLTTQSKPDLRYIIESVDSIIIESVDSISRDERDVPLMQYITNA